MENKGGRQLYNEIGNLRVDSMIISTSDDLLTFGVMAVTIEGTIILGIFPTVLMIPIARPAYLCCLF